MLTRGQPRGAAGGWGTEGRSGKDGANGEAGGCCVPPGGEGLKHRLQHGLKHASENTSETPPPRCRSALNQASETGMSNAGLNCGLGLKQNDPNSKLS
jgi:hypothetical protein